MPKAIPVIALLMLVLVSACTPMIYGVPEATWQQMSEPERVAAIDAYRQRQVVLQQAQAERARQRALQQQVERQHQAEEARRRQERIDAIYRGQGVYGDLLQVTLSGGMINFSGKHHSYPPMTFRIAEGETRDIKVLDGRGRYRVLRVSYSDGNLVLDSRGAKPNQVARFRFGPSWEDGISFPPVTTKGFAELRGVQVAVSVLGDPPHRHRPSHERRPPASRQQPQVIVVQQPASPPPRIVVIEKPQHPAAPQERHHRQPPANTHRPERAPTSAPPVVHLPSPPQPPIRGEQTQSGHQQAQSGHQQAQSGHQQAQSGHQRAQSEHQQPERTPARVRQGHQARSATVGLAPSRILVRFRNGLIKVRGRYASLQPADCRLAAGESRRIALKTSAGTQQVSLSYRDGRLSLEVETGPRGKGRDKQTFMAEKSWAKGRTYRFDSPGARLLRQVEVEVVSTHSG